MLLSFLHFVVLSDTKRSCSSELQLRLAVSYIKLRLDFTRILAVCYNKVRLHFTRICELCYNKVRLHFTPKELHVNVPATEGRVSRFQYRSVEKNHEFSSSVENVGKSFPGSLNFECPK